MKICLLADLHFGVKHNNEKFLENQLKFLRDYLPTKLEGVDKIIVLGDIFDNRYELDVSTLNAAFSLFKDAYSDFQVDMILGNHDTYYRNSNEVNSLKIFSSLPNVRVIETPIQEDEFYYLPWVNDYQSLEEFLSKNIITRPKFCFAHLDIHDAMMDKFRSSESGVSMKMLSEFFQYVLTGHYHRRSSMSNGDCRAQYIGTPYQLTMIDEDEPKGAGILDTETGKLTFIENEISSRFVSLHYPSEVTPELVTNNYVKLKVPSEYTDEIVKIVEYKKRISLLEPAGILQDEYEDSKENVDFELSEISNFDLLAISKEYIESSEMKYKEETIAKFETLYEEN